MRPPIKARIIGVGMTALGKLGRTPTALMIEALERALSFAQVRLRDLDGLLAVPSLSEPRFMEAHHLATQVGLLPGKGIVAQTIDTGGAGPVSGLLEANDMIVNQGYDLIAVLAGDSVSSMSTLEFLARADAGCADPGGSLSSPVIPHGYDRVARWAIDQGAVTREQLAMVPCIMSYNASKHPRALNNTVYSLDEVLSSKSIAPATNILECARRADGAACLLVASTRFLSHHPHLLAHRCPIILGGGQASGPLYPPRIIDEEMFSCEVAVERAYLEASLSVKDIDFFGLYDCFPICFIRALEACQIVKKGEGGRYVEAMYHRLQETGELPPETFPINTHGGLLSFGAPWEAPAMFNIIEAFDQLNGTAGIRQVPDCRRALVYGNGGIFSASSVAILGL